MADDRDDEKTGRTRRIEECEARTYAAEGAAQVAVARSGRSMSKRAASWYGLLVMCAAIAGSGWAAKTVISSKADASRVEAMEKRQTDHEKQTAVSETERKGEMGELRGDVRDLKRSVDRVLDVLLGRNRSGDAERKDRAR